MKVEKYLYISFRAHRIIIKKIYIFGMKQITANCTQKKNMRKKFFLLLQTR